MNFSDELERHLSNVESATLDAKRASQVARNLRSTSYAKKAALFAMKELNRLNEVVGQTRRCAALDLYADDELKASQYAISASIGLTRQGFQNWIADPGSSASYMAGGFHHRLSEALNLNELSLDLTMEASKQADDEIFNGEADMKIDRPCNLTVKVNSFASRKLRFQYRGEPAIEVSDKNSSVQRDPENFMNLIYTVFGMKPGLVYVSVSD